MVEEDDYGKRVVGDIMDTMLSIAATFVGCCLAIPVAIVMYMVMTRVEQMWKNSQWRG